MCDNYTQNVYHYTACVLYSPMVFQHRYVCFHLQYIMRGAVEKTTLITNRPHALVNFTQVYTICSELRLITRLTV